jgi:hypothetical protein
MSSDAPARLIQSLRTRLESSPTDTAIVSMLADYSSLALHAPLMSFAVFAGKDGECEARRVSFMLREWTTTSESRQAIWYAGQILRHARHAPRLALQTFFAVVVYQACLTLWTWSLIQTARQENTAQVSYNLSSGMDQSTSMLQLDGHVSIQEINNFVALGNGTPAVSSTKQDGTCRSTPLLGHPGVSMRAGIEILGKADSRPRFIHQLCDLMEDLAKATQSIGFA